MLNSVCPAGAWIGQSPVERIIPRRETLEDHSLVPQDVTVRASGVMLGESVSFLSSPKPWNGVAASHQENAVRSWLALHPKSEVILYGDAPGTAEACRRSGATHVVDIAGTDAGLPYFNAIVAHAALHARHDLQVYLNCDILLRHDFLKTVAQLQWAKFLMIGQRIDLPEGEPQHAELAQDDRWLKALARTGRLVLHPPDGSDYFVFPRGMWKGVPVITIGRGAYDNALIAWCLLHRIPVVDATLKVVALHQFHDYGHVEGGKKEIFHGVETEENLSVCRRFGGIIPTLEDATWMFRRGKLSRSFARGDWMRGLLDRHLRWIPGHCGRRAVVRAWGLASRVGLTRESPFDLSDLPIFRHNSPQLL